MHALAPILVLPCINVNVLERADTGVKVGAKLAGIATLSCMMSAMRELGTIRDSLLGEVRERRGGGDGDGRKSGDSGEAHDEVLSVGEVGFVDVECKRS